jgi:hypothetical protein
MKLTDFLDSDKRKSQQLVDERTRHLSTWPTVEAQIKTIDLEQCIPLARAFNDAKAAGSPTVHECEAKLKSARLHRDSLQRDFQMELERLNGEIWPLTNDTLRRFHYEILDLLSALPAKRLYRQLRGTHDSQGYRVAKGVLVSHNFPVIKAARQLYLDTIKEVQGMTYLSLSEIESRIKQFRAKFETLDFTEMTTEEVTESRASELKPNDAPTTSAGTLLVWPGPGVVPPVFVANPDAKIAPRLKQLENKLSNLEKNI